VVNRCFGVLRALWRKKKKTVCRRCARAKECLSPEEELRLCATSGIRLPRSIYFQRGWAHRKRDVHALYGCATQRGLWGPPPIWHASFAARLTDQRPRWRFRAGGHACCSGHRKRGPSTRLWKGACTDNLMSGGATAARSRGFRGSAPLVFGFGGVDQPGGDGKQTRRGLSQLRLLRIRIRLVMTSTRLFRPSRPFS